MKYTVNKNGLKIGKQVEELLQRKIKKLDRLLTHYNPDLVMLRVSFNKNKKKEMHLVRLVLELPNQVIKSEKQAGNLMKAASESFDTLIHETKKHKELLRRQHEFKRRRPSYKMALAETGLNKEIRKTFEQIIEKNMGKFYNFALREIRNRIYQGIIKPGDIAVRDVLDEAVLQLSDDLPGEFDERWVLKQMYRRINRIIQHIISQKKIRFTPIEKKIEPDDIDTELYEYYQPDNIVRVEDVVPDENILEPDEIMAKERVVDMIDYAASLLPNAWRQAFALVEADGFSPEEVAMIQNKSPEDIKKEVQMAREYLKHKLSEMGLKWGQ